MKTSSRLKRLRRLLSPYVFFPLAYVSVVVGYYWVSGRLLQFLPAVYLVCAIPVIVVAGVSRGALKYWVTLAMILLSYEALAGAFGSVLGANDVLSLYRLDEQIWGFNLTGWVQTNFYSPVFTDGTQLLYALHMPLVAAASTMIWLYRRSLFGGYVTTMAITSFSALVTYVVVPTAPPWFSGAANNLVGGGGVASLSTQLSYLNSLFEADKFAAFPSLHAAYAIIFTYFMFKVSRPTGIGATFISFGILFSTIYLGQHYLIDLIGGAVYALIPCLVSEKLRLFEVPLTSRVQTTAAR